MSVNSSFLAPVYTTQTISTIVDLLVNILRNNVYTTQTISTIVDTAYQCLYIVKVYTTQTISTIVD